MRLSAIRIPLRVHLKAAIMLCWYRQGKAFARRMHRTGYLSIPVTPRWRLLSKNEGKDWELMSHETYNRRKDR